MTPLRVLITDDEANIVWIVREALAEMDLEFETARTAGDALALIAQSPPDILIVDKNLPDGSGLDVAAALKGTDTEILMITGFASLSSAVEAMRAGVCDYIVKPFDLGDLRVRVGRAVDLLLLRRLTHGLISELEERNRHLESLVVHDPLTHLYNHAWFHESVERELSRAGRSDLPCSVVLLDLDGFRAVNDALGFEEGNRRLQRIAQEVVAGVGRSRGGGAASVARFGGDEIAVLLPETARAEAAELAEHVRVSVAGMTESEPRVTLSAGVASFPSDALDRAGLVEAADQALQAARVHRNRVVSFEPALAIAGRQRAAAVAKQEALLAGLERSIAHRLFRFEYQPIRSSLTGVVMAYEALARPLDAAFSGPEELFHAAESAGRVAELGRALREVGIPPVDRLPPDCLLFLNLHPIELSDSRFLDETRSLGHRAERVVFEITETAAIENLSRTREVIADLRSQGYRVALDDLGSGYSGLNTLARLEPEFVKFDRELIPGIMAARGTSRLIRHLVEFANETGTLVIAEGIETDEERAALEQLGCHWLQGYLLGRPAALPPQAALP